MGHQLTYLVSTPECSLIKRNVLGNERRNAPINVKPIIPITNKLLTVIVVKVVNAVGPVRKDGFVGKNVILIVRKRNQPRNQPRNQTRNHQLGDQLGDQRGNHLQNQREGHIRNQQKNHLQYQREGHIQNQQENQHQCLPMEKAKERGKVVERKRVARRERGRGREERNMERSITITIMIMIMTTITTIIIMIITTIMTMIMTITGITERRRKEYKKATNLCKTYISLTC